MSKNKKEPEPEPVAQVEKEPVIETGSGEFLFPNGAKYIGEWRSVNGLKQRHGNGTYAFGPEEYQGQWAEDAMQGHGRQSFSSGAYYEGEFHHNMFQGQGVYRFPDGATYR
jgi:hypothetical protein